MLTAAGLLLLWAGPDPLLCKPCSTCSAGQPNILCSIYLNKPNDTSIPLRRNVKVKWFHKKNSGAGAEVEVDFVQMRKYGRRVGPGSAATAKETGKRLEIPRKTWWLTLIWQTENSLLQELGVKGQTETWTIVVLTEKRDWEWGQRLIFYLSVAIGEIKKYHTFSV